MHAVWAGQACTRLGGHICQALLSDITFSAGHQLQISVASMQQKVVIYDLSFCICMHVLPLHVQYTASTMLSALQWIVSTVTEPWLLMCDLWQQQPDRTGIGSIWHNYKMHSIVTDAPVTCYALSLIWLDVLATWITITGEHWSRSLCKQL